MNGFVAWYKRFLRYKPRTPARALHAPLEVVRPPKVEELKLVAKALDE